MTPRVLRRLLTQLGGTTGDKPLWIFPGHKKLYVAPQGNVFAEAWGEYSGINVDRDCRFDWYESTYRRQSMNRDARMHYDPDNFDPAGVRMGIAIPATYRNAVARGTWVDDLIFAACRRKAGPAHLLATILYYCDRNPQNKKPRAKGKYTRGVRT